MRYYFAPLEGLTDSIYRQLHHNFYPGVDQYYTPFLSPTVHRALTPKEKRELPFADSLDFQVVPQLLTKNSDDFVWMAQQCADRGYKEINLNLGCPSGTVTAKGKGAGMLREPDTLDRFLDEIYHATPIEISIKTRIGFLSAEEFTTLLDIYNRYPIKELTIHPRVRCAFYDRNVDQNTFLYATENSRAPLCYNGDILSLKQVNNLPTVNAVMIGRGLIADPGMLSGKSDDRLTLESFFDTLLDEYSRTFGSSRNALFRLKEHWFYLLKRFDNAEKYGKMLRKTTNINEYISITQRIFAECEFKQTENDISQRN